METITPRTEMALEKKQALLDGLSESSKSVKVDEKSKKKNYDIEKDELDMSSFQFYLNKTVQQHDSPETDADQNLINGDKSFYEVAFCEPNCPQNNNLYKDILGIVSNENMSEIKNATIPVFSDTDTISRNQDGTAAGPFPVKMKDAGDANPEIQDGQIKKVTMAIIDSAIESFSLTTENKDHQVPTLSDGNAPAVNSSLPMSQNLSSRFQDNGIEEIAFPQLSQQSGIQLQTGENKTSSYSGSLQPYVLNGQINKKERSPVPENLEKDLRDNFPNNQSVKKEVVSENSSNGMNVLEDHNESQAIKNNQKVHSSYENSYQAQGDQIPFVSSDNQSLVSQSGGGKVINPQTLIDQIAGESKQIFQGGTGRIKMTLNPPSLGSLDMDVQVKNNKVEVTFIADTPEIQQSLQANSDLLKAALSQQGLKIDGYNVLLQGNMDQNRGYNFNESSLWQNTRRDIGKEEARKDQKSQPDVIPSLNMEKLSDPMDHYRISLFI